jgi:hypothetical protein
VADSTPPSAPHSHRAQCGGETNGTVWEQYARMRDALNATGASIYFSITEMVPWPSPGPSVPLPAMECYPTAGVFSVLPWVRSGLDPTTLANSYLVEYCNNMDVWGYTGGVPTPGGMLSNLDSQALLAWDNLTLPGAVSDADMLEVCNGGQSQGEYRAQFSLWSALASPLILGNDVRTLTPECAAIVLNAEVIALNQDPLVVRARLVYQWPDAHWPNTTAAVAAAAGAAGAAGPVPPPTGGLRLAACNASDPAQAFTWDNVTGLLSTTGGGGGGGVAQQQCVTYGGYTESNTYLGECTGWVAPNIGGQQWALAPPAPGAGAGLTALAVVANPGKVLDVYDCNATAADAVQVCTAGSSQCYAAGGPPPGCTAALGQAWSLSPLAAAAASPSVQVVSAMPGPAPSSAWCLAAAPPPAPVVDIRLQVWAKPLVDGSVAAVAFNRSPGPLIANVTWAMLGLPPGTRATLRDAWAHTDNGTAVDGFSAVVAPHDVVVVRVTPA